MQKIF